MKRRNTLFVSFMAAAVAAIAADSARAGDRGEMLKRFEQLKSNSLRAMRGSGIARTDRPGEGRPQPKPILVAPDVPPADPLTQGEPEIRLAVKIWGELAATGQKVNLTKHRWNPKERFWLWIESAVPLQMAVFQNYPEGRPRSRQVSPDERFPKSFDTIVPGKPFRFPVMFQMDDDLRDEQVSFVFARSDFVLPATADVVSATASASVVIDTQGLPDGCRVIADAFAVASPQRDPSAVASAIGGMQEPDGTLKGNAMREIQRKMALAKSGLEKAAVSQAKLDLVAPPSADARDVEIMFWGPGNLAQIELTLFK